MLSRRALLPGWPEMAFSPGLAAYQAISGLVTPIVPMILNARLKRGKEDGARLNERLGHPTRPRPAGPLVWLHGASVGETVSLLPLVPGFIARGFAVMLTSGTLTSAELAAKRLPEGAFHQFLPIDTPGAARRFIAHWKPDLGLIAESEIWPNLIVAASRAGIPLAIINGRMSARSLRKWSRLPGMIAAILARFDLVLAQSDLDAERYDALGARHAVSVGNLKFDVDHLPADAAECGRMAGMIGPRPVFIAASTHPGEEEIVLGAHFAARRAHPDLLTIIAPRHPHRGDPLRALAEASGLAMSQRSRGEPITPETQLYIADTIGELGLVYRLGRFAFLGGSFIPHGGQNPIEPAKLGLGVLHGPHVFNFTDVYASFDADGGAVELTDPDDLGVRVAGLLADPEQLAALQAAARSTADGLGGAMAATLAALEPFLARAQGTRR